MNKPTGSDVRAFIAAGNSQLSAAEHFGLSRSKVQRLLRDSFEIGDRAREVEDLAFALGDRLDVGARAKLGLLRSLARKVDWAEHASTGSAAMALAGLSKQYLELLEVVAPPPDDTKQWLQWTLFPPDHVRDMRVLMERIVDGGLGGDELILEAQRTLAMAEEFDAGDGSTSRFAATGGWDFNA